MTMYDIIQQAFDKGLPVRQDRSLNPYLPSLFWIHLTLGESSHQTKLLYYLISTLTIAGSDLFLSHDFMTPATVVLYMVLVPAVLLVVADPPPPAPKATLLA